jgi:hypothetical protein
VITPPSTSNYYIFLYPPHTFLPSPSTFYHAIPYISTSNHDIPTLST